MGRVDARHDRGLRAGRLPHDGARPGDRLREGRRPHRGALAQARELRPRHPVAARRSATSRSARCARPRRSGRRWRARRSRSTSPTPTTATSRCTRPASCRSATARVDPRLPTKGTGEYEWRGFLAPSQHPYQKNPPSGLLVNWNNRPAPGWGAADDNWAYGSAQRVRMLLDGLAKRDKHDLASVTAAMNAAATQDLRSVALTPVLAVAAARRPGAEPARGADARAAGGVARGGLEPARPRPRRRDRRRAGAGDLGRVLPAAVRRGDAGAGARRPRSAPTPARAAASPTAASGTSTRTCGGSTASGCKAPFNERYCGDGDRAACARAVWAALEAVPGDPDALRADATQGADQLPARAAADDDPLHEPPERHPAGDLLPRPSAET